MHTDKILVVEDDPDVRGALVAVLEEKGYGVVEAENGRDALEHLRGGAGFCLILLDLFMPEVNGAAVRTEQMRAPRLALIPVVVISADSAAAKRAVSPGIVAAMTKPVEFGPLLDLIARHC